MSKLVLEGGRNAVHSHWEALQCLLSYYQVSKLEGSSESFECVWASAL